MRNVVTTIVGVLMTRAMWWLGVQASAPSRETMTPGRGKRDASPRRRPCD